jgi:prepilin-type N-terminal cleavage/methylation domain-containing protein
MSRSSNPQAGFNLPELLIAMSIMLLIAGAATTALLKLGSSQAMIWNRTQMHSGIRGATEVLQQEVGQAGKISLPAAVTLSQAITGNPTTASTVQISSATGMFVGELLTIDAGCFDAAIPCTSRQEVVTLTGADTTASPNTMTAIFTNSHASGVSVQALGGFAAGIVPGSTTDGSSEGVLKLFGDINSDGSMVYIEYSVSPTCICSTTSPCASTTTGNLYRNSMAWNAASKVAASASQILLNNITTNPNGTACFTYQTKTLNSITYVTDVAITLTVQTQNIDPVTKAYQTETKALLNVTPRNVYNTYQFATLGYTNRIQATPASVTTLLPGSGS